MQNQFASDKQYRLIYWLIWAVLGVSYALLLILVWTVEWKLAMVDSLVFTLLFAAMGIAVWNLVRFSSVDSKSVVNNIISHVVAGGLLVFIVVAIGESIIPLIFNDASQYYSFSSEFHLYRLVIGAFLYTIVAVNFYLIVYYEEYRSKKLRESDMDKHLRSAELNMLKAQINPHFIFNSLNSVSSLTLTDSKKAHEMVINLADFLRYSIQQNAEQLVPLSKEIEALQLYMEIEKVRYGKRLNVVFEIDDTIGKQYTVPALILQPLVENAIKYSLHETDLESEIAIKCSLEDDLLMINVTNNYDNNIVVKKGAGIGLNNVRSRLQLIYGNSNLLTVKDDKSCFSVELRFPQV